jgi:hypothetical protein
MKKAIYLTILLSTAIISNLIAQDQSIFTLGEKA